MATKSDMQVFLARYGERECDLVPFVGPFNMGLADRGKLHARCIASSLQDVCIQAIFCSPFRRAIQTACIIAEDLGLPVNVEPGLTEWYVEALVGKDVFVPEISAAVLKEFPLLNASYSPRGKVPRFPESEEDLRIRCKEITERLSSEFGSVLLVSHAPCILAAALELEGKRSKKEKSDILPCALGAVFQFKQKGGSWKMVRNGSTAHMPSLEEQKGVQRWGLPSM